jgi:hypothetical protein
MRIEDLQGAGASLHPFAETKTNLLRRLLQDGIGRWPHGCWDGVSPGGRMCEEHNKATGEQPHEAPSCHHRHRQLIPP